MHGHAAGVIAPVFKSLQALHEDGNDVARGYWGRLRKRNLKHAIDEAQ